MPTVDVHQHFWPEELVDALAARSAPPRLVDRGRRLELREGTFDVELGAHDLDRRLALLERDEIDVAVVSLPPTLETDEHEDLRAAYHEGIAAVAAASGERLRPLAAGETRDGFAGACISAAAFAAGVDELLGELGAQGGFLFVHPGPPGDVAAAPPWWSAVVDYTAQMQAAFAAWLARGTRSGSGSRSAAPVVFAILAGGAPVQWERLRSRAAGVDAREALERVYLDTASYGEHALALARATIGAGRLVYGSDVPVIDPAPTLRALRGLDEAERDVVLGGNAARLLR